MKLNAFERVPQRADTKPKTLDTAGRRRIPFRQPPHYRTGTAVLQHREAGK